MLTGLIRIRNEQAVLKDTLDHMNEFCDKIYLYDDASTDNTERIYLDHKSVDFSLRNPKWNSNQTVIQGQQRSELLEYAKFHRPKSWFIYMDADERIDFDFDSWKKNPCNITMRLFDAVMTPKDYKPYTKGKLADLRRYFDPNYREIPFIFNSSSRYVGVACERYPQIEGETKIEGLVQHYGKALSKKHWKETAQYYVDNVPVYRDKWKERLKQDGVFPEENLLTWEEIKSKFK